MTSGIIAHCATVLLAQTVTGAAFVQDPHVLVPADKAAPPALPVGAHISVLEGVPGQKGAVTLRRQLPANTRFRPTGTA